MNKSYFSKKTLIILCIINVLFILLVVNAFNQLSKNINLQNSTINLDSKVLEKPDNSEYDIQNESNSLDKRDEDNDENIEEDENSEESSSDEYTEDELLTNKEELQKTLPPLETIKEISPITNFEIIQEEDNLN